MGEIYFRGGPFGDKVAASRENRRIHCDPRNGRMSICSRVPQSLTFPINSASREIYVELGPVPRSWLNTFYAHGSADREGNTYIPTTRGKSTFHGVLRSLFTLKQPAYIFSRNGVRGTVSASSSCEHKTGRSSLSGEETSFHAIDFPGSYKFFIISIRRRVHLEFIGGQ